MIITTSRPSTLAINVLVLITLSILAYVNVRLYTKIINEYPSRRNVGIPRTAAICAIQKWGLRYIDEWVDYHLAIGFQTIFIYDNSDDFETFGKLLAHRIILSCYTTIWCIDNMCILWCNATTLKSFHLFIPYISYSNLQKGGTPTNSKMEQTVWKFSIGQEKNSRWKRMMNA